MNGNSSCKTAVEIGVMVSNLPQSFQECILNTISTFLKKNTIDEKNKQQTAYTTSSACSLTKNT